MTELTNYKYHSTAQFRNVVKRMRDLAAFKGLDEEGNAILDPLALPPKVNYTGTVKLHGTNASIVLHDANTITFHSKERMLAVYKDREFTLLSDNMEFAQCMQRVIEFVEDLFLQVETLCGEVDQYPIKISGEWAGQGIQKGVGISMVPKAFFVFGVKHKDSWLPHNIVSGLFAHTERIHNIYDFTTQHICIDFANPEYSQNKLVELTSDVEEECPVARQLGVEGNILGEGLVWIPDDAELCADSGNWFKTKGKKHSVSNTKSVVAICPEKLESIKEFVEYAVTDNRLQQMLDEVGLDQKSVGTFIGAVNKDINKEEGDVLEANSLTMKDVGKYVATKSREFYITKLNEL